MQFIAFSFAALSLGSSVLAAPAASLPELPAVSDVAGTVESLPVVNTVTSDATGVVGSAESLVSKRDTVSDVTETVESLPVVNTVAGDASSVVGGLVSKKDSLSVTAAVEGLPVVDTVADDATGLISKRSVVETVTGSVSTLKTTVTTELGGLSTSPPVSA